MSTQSLEISNDGQIEQFNLPSGWVEVAVARPEHALWSMRDFRPQADSPVRLSIFHRGAPVSVASAESFKTILSGPVHSLSYDEFWSLQQVLRDAALPDQFELLLAETIEVNGVKVLSVHGSWPKLKVDSFGIFISANELSTHIQEIYFFAPRDDYDSNWHVVQTALRSIKWKNVALNPS